MNTPPPPARCSAAIAKDGPPAIPYQSLYEMFQASVQKFPNNNCLGRREGAGYSWLTYKQTSDQVADIGSALVKAGLQPHGRVGVYGANSPEWMIAMQVGCLWWLCWAHARLRCQSGGMTRTGLLRVRQLAVQLCSASLHGRTAAGVLLAPAADPCVTPRNLAPRPAAGVQPAEPVLRAAVRLAGRARHRIHRQPL